MTHAGVPGDIAVDLDVLEHDLVVGQRNLEAVLASALAVERDVRLLAAVSATHDATAIALGPRGPYVIVEGGRITRSAMLGSAPAGVERVLALPEALALRPSAGFRTALDSTEAVAQRAIHAMCVDAERYTQDAFGELQRWAPLLALHAYCHSVTLQSIFDLERVRAAAMGAPAPRADPARLYLLGHLTVLATSAEPTTWLAEMSRSFAWRVWTPSFPLVRERILRLAVRGGWAAARFGTDVVAPYFARLSTGQPMHAFDAVLGLVAIATVTPSDRAAIATELFAVLAQRAREAYPAIFEALARSARLALEAPDDAHRHVLAGRAPASEARLAAAVDSDDDGAVFDADGYFPAILAMAGLAGAPAHVWFATRERAEITLARARTEAASARWTN